MRSLCNYWEISSIRPGSEKTSPHTEILFSHFELASQKDKRKALMQLIRIACPQKKKKCFISTEQLRSLRSFQQHPPAAEKSKPDAHKQDVQGLRAAKQTLQRQLTPYEAKIWIMMAHLSHNPTERKLQHSARIDRLLAENGWSTDKFHNAVCTGQPRTAELCPADPEVLALHHPLIRSFRAAAIWSHQPFPPTPMSWGSMVCRQISQTGLCLQKVSTIMAQKCLSPLLPSFPTQSITGTLLENLLLKHGIKYCIYFWVLPLCWSWAWLHNSLLKPFCSNICRELCEVISVHCQASLRFALALTPSVKIRQCFTAWVNPYRCPSLSGIKMQL